MAFGEFFLRDKAGSPERARWLHLARSGSQSQRTIWVILPARGASHIIKQFLFTRNLLCSMFYCTLSTFFNEQINKL